LPSEPPVAATSEAPTVPTADSATEVEKARSELNKMLEEIAAEHSKTTTELDKSKSDNQSIEPLTEATVGDDIKGDIVPPAQPTVPATASDQQSEPVPPLSALVADDETDLPVATAELKKIHDEVVDEELGVTRTEKTAQVTRPDQPAQATQVVDQVKREGDELASTQVGPSEKLNDQNIFFMLGIEGSKQSDKESFLDELQQIVWEDFLENDAKTLLQKDEFTKLEAMLQQKPQASFSEQADIVDYLEKLIPDLEEVMVEKAVKLKKEMFIERIKDLRQRYATEADKLAVIDQAEQLMQQDQWYSAAKKLNELK